MNEPLPSPAPRPSSSRFRRLARLLPVLVSMLLLLSLGASACGDTAPEPQDAIQSAVEWLRDGPTAASGAAHEWVIAEQGTVGRHRAGPSPGLDAALGPFAYEGETYYFAYADQPGEQWYDFRAADINEIWTAGQFTEDQKIGLATLLAVMRLTNPERVLSHWDPQDVEISESEETDDAWVLTGTLISIEAVEEGLDQPVMDAIRESDLFPGDMAVELTVAKDDGRPLSATFDPENGRPFSFTFERTDETPDLPEDTIGVRQLLEEGPVGSPVPGNE